MFELDIPGRFWLLQNATNTRGRPKDSVVETLRKHNKNEDMFIDCFLERLRIKEQDEKKKLVIQLFIFSSIVCPLSPPFYSFSFYTINYSRVWYFFSNGIICHLKSSIYYWSFTNLFTAIKKKKWSNYRGRGRDVHRKKVNIISSYSHNWWI